VGLFILVAFSGACLGAFRVEWVRTDSTGFHLYTEGRVWVERLLGSIPFVGAALDAAWGASWLNAYTAHFPGIVCGSVLAVFVWLGLSLGAAWQNSLLFGSALRRIALRFSPLVLYLPLAAPERYFDRVWYHGLALVPFAAVAFSLAAAIRAVRAEALPKKGRPKGPDGAWDFLPLTLVWIVALVRFVDWYHISSMRHQHFHSQGYDLGLMSHVLQNFIRGEGLTSSLIVSGGSFLGHHFSPILYLLAPFYYFCPNPEILLLAQAAAVAFATVPLYLYARMYLGNAWTAASLALSFLYLPGLSEGVYSDFHAICFAPILLFWLAYEIQRTDRNRYWLPALLLFCVQENALLYALAYSLYLLFDPLLRKRGYVLLCASFVALVLVFAVFQPLLRPSGDLGYGFVHRYKDFLPEGEPGSSGVGRLLVGILSSPGTVLQKTIGLEALSVYGRHWGGVFWTPLWNPMGWVILAPCLENLLSSEEMMRLWGIHYSFGPLALSSLAMVAAFGFWRRYVQFAKVSLPLSTIILFSAIFWAMRRSQVPYSIFMMAVFYDAQIEPPQMREALVAEIPYGSSVAAQSHLLPHLTYQRALYLIPPGMPQASEEATIPDGNTSGFNGLTPNVPWPDYLVYNPDKADSYWYNLWFHSEEWVKETKTWIDWAKSSGRYVQTYPRQGSPAASLPVVVLRRADLAE